MIENALVVPELSQNLTSHKQFIENGHMTFFKISYATSYVCYHRYDIAYDIIVETMIS